jgi:ABC-type uncharacterized transport system involved in gliding motility auxiliary subunit
MLSELSSYSNAHLRVQFLNPSLSEVEDQAQRLGIPQIRMNIVEKDKFEVKNGYLGAAVIYGDHVEVLPVVQEVLNIEYDLVASIKKVTAPLERQVAFVTGHGEPALDPLIVVTEQGNAYSRLKKALERNFRVSEVDLSLDVLPEEVDTLIVAGPKTTFSAQEQSILDQFLVKGGHVVMLIDAVEINELLEPSLLNLGLNSFLEKRGIQLKEQLVLDSVNESASFNQGFTNFIVPYPLWVKVIEDNFDAKHPIVNRLEAVVFPWTSPLTVDSDKAMILATTSDEAWVQKEPFTLDPNLIETVADRQSFPLAVLVNSVSMGTTRSGRLLVVGNSRFVEDRYVQQFGQNLDFVLNAIDFLTLDESLITIRSRTSIDLPLRDLTVQDRQWVRFIGTFMMPILVILYGLLRYWTRRRRKYLS